jgi:cold shock protein
MTDRILGRVKWFNNRAGFGFVTVLDGDKKNDDVFVHHSGVNVEKEQYKYLVQGEYVSFTMKQSDNQEHPFQAGDVTGVMGGKLMCETRMENRREQTDDGDDSNPRRRGGGPRGQRRGQRRSEGQVYGGNKDSESH